MACEEDDDKGAAAPGDKSKNRWWLTLGLLLLFLAGGGYYTVSSMRAAAHKLAEGANNGALGEDSSVSSGDAAGKKEDLFASGEAAPAKQKASGSALNDKLRPGWVKEMIAERAAARQNSDGSGASPVTAEAAQEEERARASGGASATQHAGDSMGAKLQAKGSFGGHSGAAGPSKGASTAQAGDFDSGEASSGKPLIQKNTQAGLPRKGGGGGVMDALKGAFRASFYGARIASQDSAKSWVAKTFDATADSNTSIEYDEKMRAKLDVVNPNSIPKFLRDQDVNSAEAKTLAPGSVSSPQGDSQGTSEALKIDKDYQNKKAMGGIADGMLNGLYSGVSGGSSGDSKTVINLQTDVDWDEDPTLDGVDGTLPTQVPGADGITYIFGADGTLLGCDDGKQCLLPGASGCSAGTAQANP